MNEFFETVLNIFVERGGYTSGQLSRLSGIPKPTIVSWLEGRVLKPRNWQDIIKLAASMRLNEAETNRLLQAAGHRTLTERMNEAQQKQDEQLLTLVSLWIKQRRSASTDSALLPKVAPFQAPHRINDFVGRENLLQELSDVLIAGGRICILQGMGGVGKTSIATHLAYELSGFFPDGILWATLTNAFEADTLNESILLGILGTFAAAFGRDISDETSLDNRSRVVRQMLANKQVLIVLDNADSTEVIQPLLPPSTDTCSVLITTRNKRMLRNQAISFDVIPFDMSTSLKMLECLIGKERVADEKEGAQRIIKLLGGLPLAVRIVGSDLVETGNLTLQEYYDLLLDERTRLEYLTDWDDASKDVRASFELSFKRLPEKLQQLFISLAVFDGPDFSFDSVAAVTNIREAVIKRQLGQLQALSLLRAGPAIQPYKESTSAIMADAVLPQERYHLHALLKLFVTEKLAGVETQAFEGRWKATTYFVNFAHQQGRTDYHYLDIDWENIWGALQWAIQQNAWDLLAIGTAGLTQINLGVIGYLDARGYWREATRLLQTLLNANYYSASIDQAIILFKLGAFALRQADSTKAENYLMESWSLFSKPPMTETAILGQAYVCEWMAEMLMGRDQQGAEAWSQRGIELLQGIESSAARHEEGYLLIRHATILGRTGQITDAIACVNRGLVLLPDTPSAARVSAYMTLGVLQDITGERNAAKENWDKGVEQAKVVGDSRRLAGLWRNLALQAGETGDLQKQQAYTEQSLQLYQLIGDIVGEGHTSANLGYLHTLMGKHIEAGKNLETAKNLAIQNGMQDLEAIIEINLARWHITQLQYEEASLGLDIAHGICEKLKMRREIAEILRLRAQVAMHKDAYQEALKQIDSALELTQTYQDTLETGRNFRSKGDVLHRTGRIAEAEDSYKRSIKCLSENQFEQSRSCLALGIHYSEVPAFEQAQTWLGKALTGFKELNLEYYIQQTQEALDSMND